MTSSDEMVRSFLEAAEKMGPPLPTAIFLFLDDQLKAVARRRAFDGTDLPGYSIEIPLEVFVEVIDSKPEQWTASEYHAPTRSLSTFLWPKR